MSLIAFCGNRCIASGEPSAVALAAKRFSEAGGVSPLLVFDAETSHRIELDLRGTDDEICAQLASSAQEPAAEAPARGRPKLGVTAREVTLLPRHWDWLSAQPGGASAALRRLVEEARRTGSAADARRQAQEAAHRFITVMAGDAAGYEDAIRALYRGDAPGFGERTAAWPEDVREHALGLAAKAFAGH